MCVCVCVCVCYSFHFYHHYSVLMFLQCVTLGLTETKTISIVKSAPAVVSIAVITFMDAINQVGYEKTGTFVK